LIKNDGNPCGETTTKPGNNVIGPANAFAAIIVRLGDKGWLDYGGSSWLKEEGKLVGIIGNRRIATNASVRWFTN
jgi:hypothetical protein